MYVYVQKYMCSILTYAHTDARHTTGLLRRGAAPRRVLGNTVDISGHPLLRCIRQLSPSWYYSYYRIECVLLL